MEEQKAWSFQQVCSSVIAQLLKGWQWFDKWGGWLIGLDNSKYQWAVAEYQLQKQEDERQLETRLCEENAVQQNMEEGGSAALGQRDGALQAGSSGQANPPAQLEMTSPASNTIVR